MANSAATAVYKGPCFRCKQNDVICVSGLKCGMCVFVKPSGRTAYAKPGDSFFDGCTW